MLRARVLGGGPTLRIALVQTAAALLSGDRIRIDVRLGSGAAVELREVAGLVAHDVRRGPAARLDIRITLGAGARLWWAAEPLVLAGGCALLRRTTIYLEEGAAVLLRDRIVLGRVGEAPGRLRSCLAVRRLGVPLHVEDLDTGDLALLRSTAVLGDAAALDTLALYGTRAPDAAALQLAGPGSVRPCPAPSAAAAERVIGPALATWHGAWAATGVGSKSARATESSPSQLAEPPGEGVAQEPQTGHGLAPERA